MAQLAVGVLVLIVCVFVYWFLLAEKWRSIFLLAASIIFMALFSVKYTLYFLLNATVVYWAGRKITQKDKNKKLYLQLTLLWLIGSLCFFKYASLIINPLLKISSSLSPAGDHSFTSIAVPLGLSYICFRLIHYVVEMYRHKFPEHSFTDMLLYVFFSPTFVAGPVDRFQRFQPQTAERKKFDPADINYGLFRIISGMIKKFIIADNLTPLIMPLLETPQDYSGLLVLLVIYGLSIQIYMDFSGYTDIALGVSRLFGYRIVENFNNPFFKKNIALFWRNWHMSVYNFIRDYFFLPFFGYRATPLKIYIGLFMTMVIFCLWHEGNLPFLILGVYHGSGLVVWHAFQEMKARNRKLRKFVDNPVMDPISIFLTFNFVSVGMLVFFVDIPTIKSIFHVLFT